MRWLFLGGGSKVFHILVTYKHLFNKKNTGQRNLKKSVVLLLDLVPKMSPKCNCLYPISMLHLCSGAPSVIKQNELNMCVCVCVGPLLGMRSNFGKSYFLIFQQISIANSLVRRGGVLFSAGILSGGNLGNSCECSHSLCEFICSSVFYVWKMLFPWSYPSFLVS